MGVDLGYLLIADDQNARSEQKNMYDIETRLGDSGDCSDQL